MLDQGDLAVTVLLAPQPFMGHLLDVLRTGGSVIGLSVADALGIPSAECWTYRRPI